MKYQRAGTLTLLPPGVLATARVLSQSTSDGPFATLFWDLDSGNAYVMVQGGTRNPIKFGPLSVPEYVRKIIAATDDYLETRQALSEGSEREAIDSERAFRAQQTVS